MSGSDESARLERVYDLSATAAWIRAGGFRRVALQIPDDLLHDAVNLAAALERRCVASAWRARCTTRPTSTFWTIL